MKTDFLVIGTGIAGLSFAIKAAKKFPSKKVSVLCKSKPKETNTRYAQGGIAAVLYRGKDSLQKHIQDTLAAGDGLCNRKVVEFVVKEAPARIKELAGYGVKFDRSGGVFSLAREGGHSERRILHRGDFTGLEIERKLLAYLRKLKNAEIISEATAIDLITDRHIEGAKKKAKKTCYGAFVLFNGKPKAVPVISKITLLASGGIGQIFEHTTNPAIATGDGIAMAHRAGARIDNMEFIQFHPTAMHEPFASKYFLISEAVRGSGAVLRNMRGEAFMKDYDKRRDLATRDIVSRSIKSEIEKQSEDHVFLDCTAIPKKEFLKHFPTIATRCLSSGIDPGKQMIPVVPAAHYCCGGIKTGQTGRTSVRNLYACGECASTGLHGANRLASNSLLEAVVFAHRSFNDAAKRILLIEHPGEILTPVIKFNPGVSTHDEKIQRAIKKVMTESVGITTNYFKIAEGIQMLKNLRDRNRELIDNDNSNIQTRNMLDTALLVLEASQLRKVNAGVFFNYDNCGAGSSFAGNLSQIDFNLIKE